MRLLIVGAGGYGYLVKEIAEQSGFESVDFLDDINPVAVGKIDDLEKIEDDYDGSIVAIGNSSIRREIFSRLTKSISVIHPTAVVSPSAKVCNGCVIEANSVLNSEVILGFGSFVCAGAVINHNARVGNFCQIDCNAVVGMGTTVPDGMKIESCSVYK